ncbi:hypothetical protein RJT34_31070 [Clitoria ternatea]|uniref:Uncharacterized protein n=1 Tax=Clitoria ternatea TaxID=43366 RepID=A0AAN9EUU2_CLITE
MVQKIRELPNGTKVMRQTNAPYNLEPVNIVLVKSHPRLSRLPLSVLRIVAVSNFFRTGDTTGTFRIFCFIFFIKFNFNFVLWVCDCVLAVRLSPPFRFRPPLLSFLLSSAPKLKRIIQKKRERI